MLSPFTGKKEALYGRGGGRAHKEKESVKGGEREMESGSFPLEEEERGGDNVPSLTDIRRKLEGVTRGGGGHLPTTVGREGKDYSLLSGRTSR